MLALPIPLRLLLTAQPKLVTPVLQVVHRAITRCLLDQAGLKAVEADSGAVKLIQPNLWMTVSAVNLDIHLPCLVLDGVYRYGVEDEPVFVELPAPTDETLQAVLHKIITRLMKLLTRRGVLVKAQGQTTLANNDSDTDEARTRRPLQAVPGQWPGPSPGTNSRLDCLSPGSAYRIAFGPRAGQKVLTLPRAMPRDADFKQTLCADIDGNRTARRRALRCQRPPGAGATVPQHHAPGPGQRARANQRLGASGAQAQDSMTRRHHACGDITAGVHAVAGCAGAKTETAPHSFGVRATSLREVSGPPLHEPWRSGGQCQDARAGGAARF